MRQLGALATVTALLLPGRALAGNDDELPVGNRAALMGGAVSATVEDASATWYNPAGLGNVTRHSIEASGSAYTLRLYDADDFIGSTTGNASDETLSEFVTVPTQIAFTVHLKDGINLGLGYFAPRATDFVLRTSLDDDPNDWAVGVTIESVRYAAGAAVGFRVTPTLRLGVGLIGHYEGYLEAGSAFGVVREADTITKTAQAGFIASADRFLFELVAGVQWDVTPWLVVAAALRSPQASVAASATSSQQVSFSDLTVPSAEAASLEDAVAIGSRELVNAGRYALGVALRLRWGTLTAEADVQPRFENEDADVDRFTLVNARVGVLAPVSDTLRLGAGLFTDRSPDRLSEVGLLGLEADFYGTTLGLELGNRYVLAKGEEYDTIRFSTTFALRYAFSDAKTKAIRVDPSADVDSMFDSEPAKIRIHEFGLYVGGGVYF